MKIQVRKRLFLAAAVVAVLAVFAAAFFASLAVRSVVAGPDAGPAGPVPNPGHAWTDLQGHGVDAAATYINTQDDQALELRVNSNRVLRLDAGRNVIGGYGGNSVTAGVFAATIAGGGWVSYTNRVTDSYGTVGGGRGNQAGDNSGTISDTQFATVGGGVSNVASGDFATVAGGSSNEASADRSTVGGGYLHLVTDAFGTVAGGYANRAGNANADELDAQHATVGGGNQNAASGTYATVGGGYFNTAGYSAATVAGGSGNHANATYATVGGGKDNEATAQYATVAGGYESDASATYATVGGGYLNIAGNFAATVAGGYETHATGSYATVGGGYLNWATDGSATVGGGYYNRVNAAFATVAGGDSNLVTDNWGAVCGGYRNQAGDGAGSTNDRSYATVAGGYYNEATGSYATVPGGRSNSAAGDYSFAAGRRAKASNDGCFVWTDSTDADLTCYTADRFLARASGGVYLYTNSTATTGCWLTAGGNAWSCSSDRNLKENFQPVDGQEVLASLAEMPITTWNMKGQDDSIRHMGPVAQDLYAAFGLGESDTSISTADADGVALAAIQGLHQIVQELQAENTDLKAQLGDLQERVSALEGGAPADGESAGPLASMMPAGWLLLAGLVVGGLVLVQRRHAGGRP